MVEVQERGVPREHDWISAEPAADREQERLVRAARRGDAAARDRLVADHLGLVRNLARRFANRGEQLDDLIQVGTLALIAGIDRFDGRGGADFHTFAVRTVVGSLRNHLRDRGTPIRIPRRIHDLTPAVRRRELELSLHLHRRASTAELAADMGLCEEDVRDVLSAADVRVPLSIADPRVSDPERLGSDERDVHEAVAERLEVAEALRTLTPRERVILRLRFVDELTQAEIARQVGISQVHVSRLIRDAVEKLRRELDADEPESLVGDAA
jgi:RNA polymerase sigma-B factor